VDVGVISDQQVFISIPSIIKQGENNMDAAAVAVVDVVIGVVVVE